MKRKVLPGVTASSSRNENEVAKSASGVGGFWASDLKKKKKPSRNRSRKKQTDFDSLSI